MSDTVYEFPDDAPRRGYIGFTRFWNRGEDWIQITLINQDEMHPEVHTFASLPFSAFTEAFIAAAKSVHDTKDAWWHQFSKGADGEAASVAERIQPA